MNQPPTPPHQEAHAIPTASARDARTPAATEARAASTPWFPLFTRDGDALARLHYANLRITRAAAKEYADATLDILARRGYAHATQGWIDLAADLERAMAARHSIRPDAALPAARPRAFASTWVDVANETSLGAARRLVDEGWRNPLILNFANGLHPGGGFLVGSRAQEEYLCRSSGLYATLVGDDMYRAHAHRSEPDSTDWAIYSPHVPVIRNDRGELLDQPWFATVLTCAAPVAQRIGLERSQALLAKRIRRVYAIAEAYGHDALVLGAWGCGAFGNDPSRTANSFLEVLSTHFTGAFERITFAIADWSSERHTLGPFARAVTSCQDASMTVHPRTRLERLCELPTRCNTTVGSADAPAPGSRFRDLAEAWQDLAIRDGWVIPGFHWLEWTRTEAAQALFEDGPALAHASEMDLTRMSTAMVRQERFAEGFVENLAERGLIERMAARAERLLAGMEEGS